MTKNQRIAAQRVMAREAIAKLRCIEELIATEDRPEDDGEDELRSFSAKTDEFERWIFDESPIA